jgi:type II secretion system protein H
MTCRPRRHLRRAFTLIELILVLVILSTALAIAAPSLRGWSKGSKLRDAADQFQAVTRWARAQAIAESQTYRLNVEAHEGRYWLTTQDGMEFVPVASDFGAEFVMPDGATITMTQRDQSQPLEFVTFYPTGRTTAPAIVRLADDRGTYDFICDTPAEGFRRLKFGEQIQ